MDPNALAADAAPPAASSGSGAACSVDEAFAASAGRCAKQPAKRRTLERQTTELEVQKAIRDNLRDWTPEEIDGNRCPQGFTARETLTKRKRDNRENPRRFPLGKKFYEQLKQTFASKADPAMKALSPQPNDGEVSTLLLEGMIAFTKTGNRAPLAGAICLVENVTRADVVGVFRWALKIRPKASPEQQRYATNVARFIARLDLSTKFPKEVGALQDWLDKLMLHQFSQVKGQNKRPSTFVHSNRDIAFLVLPQQVTEKVLAHTGNFSNVEADLVTLCQTRLGTALFGSALHGVLAERVQKKIDEAFVQLVAGGTVSKTSFSKAHVACAKDLLSQPYIKLLPEKRLIALTYRGLKFNWPVKSVVEQVEACFVAKLKTLARDAGVLTALCCEDDLAEQPETAPTIKIEDCLLQPWCDARRAATTYPSGAGSSPLRCEILKHS